MDVGLVVEVCPIELDPKLRGKQWAGDICTEENTRFPDEFHDGASVVVGGMLWCSPVLLRGLSQNIFHL